MDLGNFQAVLWPFQQKDMRSMNRPTNKGNNGLDRIYK